MDYIYIYTYTYTVKPVKGDHSWVHSKVVDFNRWLSYKTLL